MMLRSLYLSETGEYEFDYNTAYRTFPNYRTLSRNINFTLGTFFVIVIIGDIITDEATVVLSQRNYTNEC